MKLPKELIDNPPFIKASGFYKGRNKPVELIVIHTMEAPEKGTTAESCAKYFQTKGLKASAHYCVDNNSLIQCVYDSNTAWHCVHANSNGIGIEHAGFAKQNTQDWNDEYSQSMLEISAQISAYLSNKFNIPVVRAQFYGKNDFGVKQKGFCGHVDVPLHGFHYDPGVDFPWNKYLELVNEFLPDFC